MSFLDWTDPEAIVGMLVELVNDARTESDTDETDARYEMLDALQTHLESAEEIGATDSLEGLLEHLRHSEEQIDLLFDQDPIAVELRKTIEELERLEHES